MRINSFANFFFHVTVGIMVVKVLVVYFMVMITEGQKYISSILKTFGFACFTPFGSVLFQFMVLNKSMLDGHLILCIMSSFAGSALLFFGYNIVKEKKKSV